MTGKSPVSPTNRVRLPMMKEVEIQDAARTIRFSRFAEREPIILALLTKAEDWTRTRRDGRVAIGILDQVVTAIATVPAVNRNSMSPLELLDAFITLLAGGQSGDHYTDRLVERGYLGEGPAIYDVQGYPFTSPALTAQREESVWRYEGSIRRPVLILWRYDEQGAR